MSDLPSDTTPAPVCSWLCEPMPAQVGAVVERVRRADDVARVAVMPDVHLAAGVCVGMVIATRRLLYPGAVGGDIGCGMLALAFDAEARRLADPATAGAVLRALGQRIPSQRRHRRHVVPWPGALKERELSHGALAAVARDEGVLQMGTLGGGNHFVELQSDEEGRLWLMIHSGSRAMGQAIRHHHVARARPAGAGLVALDAGEEAGRAYANDVEWARAYASANREAMARAACEVVREVLGAGEVEGSMIGCDHNHVALEEHGGAVLWVHRKGAMPAREGVAGVLPGSMGTSSYHVEGRGHAEALRSSAHGAGRAMSRERARQTVSRRALFHQMEGVWFDPRLAESLREEAPRAYKDVGAVLRAQRELVKVTRVLRPVVAYKSG